MKRKSNKNVSEDELIATVREMMGEELLKQLSTQPPCTANGGMEAILQRACKESAGYPQPAKTAVMKVRVLCGSRAVPKPQSKA